MMFTTGQMTGQKGQAMPVPGKKPSIPFAGTAQAFQQTFGPLTTQQILDAQKNGGGPGGEIKTNSRQPWGGAGMQQPQGAAAAQMNSAVPGFFNGNPFPGSVPGREGFDPSAIRRPPPGPGAPGSLALEMRSQMGLPGYGAGPATSATGAIFGGMQQAPPPPPMQPPAPPPAAPPAAPSVGAAPEPVAASMGVTGTPDERSFKAMATTGTADTERTGQFSDLPADVFEQLKRLPGADRNKFLTNRGYVYTNGKWVMPGAPAAPPPTSGGGATTQPPVGQQPPAGQPPATTQPPVAGAKPATSTFDPSDPTTWWDAEGNPTWNSDVLGEDDREWSQRYLQPKPANWSQMTPQQRENWKKNNYNPYESLNDYLTQAPDAQALQAFQRLFGDQFQGINVNQLPTQGYGTVPTVIPNTASRADFATPGSQYYVENTTIQSILDAMMNQSENLDAINRSPSGYGSDAWDDIFGRYSGARALLKNLYGIEYDPFSAYTGANIPGDTLDIGDNTKIDTTLPTTDVLTGDLARYFNDVDGGKKLALEFAMQRWLTEQGLQRQQQGINLLQPVVDQTLAANNPMRQESERLMLEALQNPDPVDWQGIRNRATSDSDAGLLESIRAASGGANRRGVPAGAMSGLAGVLTSQNRNDLSRRLGELLTEEQRSKRSSLYDALTMAGNTSRQWQGAESMARQQLANAVMGAPSIAQNPYAGMADTRFGARAIDLQRQAMEDQDTGTDWAGLATGLLGTAAGAFLGNPGLMASGATSAAGSAKGG